MDETRGRAARQNGLARAERWVALLHRLAMTALALVSLWLLLR
jgi:hypothetical protein